MSQALTLNPSFQKAQRHYSDVYHVCSAFGNTKSPAKIEGLPASTVKNYLSTSSTYTKYKQTRRKLPRLKVLSYHLNEIWSIDLVDMQSVQSFNNGVRYHLVAVEILSSIFKSESNEGQRGNNNTSILPNDHQKKRFQNSGGKPERLWADDGTVFGRIRQIMSIENIRQNGT